MSLKQDIQNNLKSAFKNRRELETGTLRMLNSQILNKEKEKRNKLSGENLSEDELVKKSELIDEEIVEVVLSEVKKRKEAIEGYEKWGREKMAEKERRELEILEKYMPEQLSEEEVKKMVKEVIDKVGAEDLKDIGKVMAELMPKVKGKAEGGMVSKTVKELLS